jgi:hypothetical protein
LTYLDDTGALIRAEVPADLVPEDSDALFRLYAVLLRAKGAAVTADDVHDAWAAWMQSHQPNHTAIQPYDHLDRPTQDEDRPFVQAIRRVAEREAR